MTGFGRASARRGARELSVQLTAVNRKGLDLTLSLPSGWDAHEALIAERVRRVAARGKIHVRVELSSEASTGPQWDEVAAAETLARLARFGQAYGLAGAPTPELVWQILQAHRQGGGGAITAAEATPWLEEVLAVALADFVAMRAREGAALQADLLARLELLAQAVTTIAQRAPLVPGLQREALLKRLREAGLALDLADERLLKEVALFADRCDISEELTRLRSHLEQMDALLRGGSEAGRKGEFLLQEISREIHTIGSKGNDLRIAQTVIELKNEVERIREQLANVE